MDTRQQSIEDWIKDYEGETMDMTKYSKSDSKDLKAVEYIGQNMKVVISGVEIRNYPASDGKPANSKPVVSFVGREKQLVMNATNTKILCSAYGNNSDTWMNHEIGLSVADYTDKGFGHGWVVTPLDIEPADFDDTIPF